jgi:hypothetical protein
MSDEELKNMTTGPIEFLGEQAVDKIGDTEYGGAPGLIQPEVDPLGGEGHHMTASETSSAMKRASAVPLSEAVARSGETTDQDVIDPHTGRQVLDEDNKDVSGGGAKFSDQKP